MLVLYHHNISVCAQKVRIALAEKKLPYERRHINLMKAEQVSPDYLKINPKGVVPALVHNGQPVIESTVIMEYLDDAFPERPLRPAAPLARARMRVWRRSPTRRSMRRAGRSRSPPPSPTRSRPRTRRRR